MNGLIEKALEAVLIAQKKLHESVSDEESQAAEIELKTAEENLVVLEARLELLNKLGSASGLPNIQNAALSKEAIEKFMELLMK